jgi:hypothetical protein
LGARDRFGGLIDTTYRCTSARQAADAASFTPTMTGPHTHGWREEADHQHVRGMPLPPFRLLRWDDAGEWLDKPGQRLRWCALAGD